MSDSLRDQLLRAGFSKSKAEPAKSKQRKSPHVKRQQAQHKAASQTNAQARHTSDSRQSKQTPQDAAIAQRKALKAQIKMLIEAAAIKEFNGEIVYRFTLQNRIRELHVNEDTRNRLVADELVITRLNGSTFLVPALTAQAIKTLNPDWAIVVPTDASSDTTEDYDNFPVPDDLQW